MNPKRKQTIILVVAVLVLALLAVGIWLIVRSGNEPGHTHTPILVEAKEATCSEAGNNAYYRCECGKFFIDGDCKNETTEEAQVIPSISHDSLTDGNCTTEDQCPYCDSMIGEANAEHTDSDGDYICDNPNCAVTMDGAPKDDNEGIDLPIDRN